MNRRFFLSSLIASGLTAAIDPERLLWIPGTRTIFIPPPRLCTPVIYGIILDLETLICSVQIISPSGSRDIIVPYPIDGLLTLPELGMPSDALMLKRTNPQS